MLNSPTLKIYTVADYTLSPLGTGTNENFGRMLKNDSGLQLINEPEISQTPYCVSIINTAVYISGFSESQNMQYSTLELQIIFTIKKLLASVRLTDFSRFLLLISTTKGNIDLLLNNPKKIDRSRVYLPVMAYAINEFFSFPNKPVVISNACISGVSAILVAKKMIQNHQYDHVLVVGADSFSKFVFSGFQSFLALSEYGCKPYDKERNGINLGEAVTAILVSSDPGLCVDKMAICEISGGGQANDANHISGPSRDGAGLKIAINKSLDESGIAPGEIGFINAHGTATVFNDEMESIAFSSIGLNGVHLNSLKGYFGHTLGAAGVLETALTIRQINHGTLLQSLGYKQNGVSHELNVLQRNTQVTDLKYALKTASGFGGGNAAIILKKVWN